MLSFVFVAGIDAAEEAFNGAATDIYQDPGFNLSRDFSGSGQADQIDTFSGMPKIVVDEHHLPGNVVF